MKKLLVLVLSGIAIIPTTLTSTGCNSKIELGSSVGKGITYSDIDWNKVSLQFAEVGLLNGKISTVEINETIGGFSANEQSDDYYQKAIDGKTFEEVKKQLDMPYSYTIEKTRTSLYDVNGKDTYLCYLQTVNQFGNTTYTGLQFTEDEIKSSYEICFEVYGGQWIDKGGSKKAKKTSDKFSGKNTDGSPIAVLTESFDDGKRSMRDTYGKPYGFHDKNNGYGYEGQKDWMDNVTLIEEFFKGKTWNDIESMNEFTGENKTDKKTQIPGVIYDVDGAKNDEIITTYALRVKDAVKKALGK